MILNVSGRTDIVAFYTPWFLNRLKEGFIDVRNPFYEKQVSRIYLEDVDAIVFCTKNPLPIVKHLKEIEKPILFHVTLTPYEKEIEPNVPPKGHIIEAVKEISKQIGRENLYVRYDPIFLSPKYTVEYHIHTFEKLCSHLVGFTEHMIVSFIDPYKNTSKNKKIIQDRMFQEKDYERIGISFSQIASKYGMTVQTCFEKENLVKYGFTAGECLSKELAIRLTGKEKHKTWKARSCGCIEMVDIGVYNTCSHFCKYCYANYDEEKVLKNKDKHDPFSSLLIGSLEEDDIIKVRK